MNRNEWTVSFRTDGRLGQNMHLGAMAEIEERKLMDDIRNKVEGQSVKHDAIGVPNSESEGLQHQLNLANKLARKLGQERMIGAGKYGTVVVSARYDRFPVPVYMHFLPPYFYNGDLAMYKAATILSTESVSLEKIYFLKGGHSQYFEFSSSDSRILIHSYNLEIIPRERALRHTEKEVIRDPTVMSQIAEEWIKIEKEVE